MKSLHATKYNFHNLEIFQKFCDIYQNYVTYILLRKLLIVMFLKLLYHSKILNYALVIRTIFSYAPIYNIYNNILRGFTFWRYMNTASWYTWRIFVRQICIDFYVFFSTFKMVSVFLWFYFIHIPCIIYE